MPVLSVGPVPIDALLAPVPAAEPDEEAAIEVVDGVAFWLFNASVRAQAGF